MAKKIILDGQKYDAQAMVRQLLDSIGIYLREAKNEVGESGEKFHKIALDYADAQLKGIQSCLNDLKEIQKQLKK